MSTIKRKEAQNEAIQYSSSGFVLLDSGKILVSMLNLEIIKYLKKRIIKIVLHIFWLFPLERKKVFLLNALSYSYGDNLKYIDIYINKHNEKNLKKVFVLKDEHSVSTNDVIVKPFTIPYFKEILTSGTIITNAGGVSYLPKRKGQKIINTWHGGGPYKKTSLDAYDGYWYRKEIKMNRDNTDYILSSCKYFTEIEAKSMGFEEGQCILIGSPRNDILFGEYTNIVKKVRDFFLIPEGKKFILYAPTFRSNSNRPSSRKIAYNIDLDVNMLLSTLKTKFGCDWTCGIRLHPKLANIDMSNMNVINCTSYPDMQELLCCADVIITDYSSLMWDYSFTYRPIFLYAPDIEKYEKERGFYMPVSEWPYPIAHDNDEMRDNILNFDEKSYIERVKQHHAATGSYETGRACEKVVELISS